MLDQSLLLRVAIPAVLLGAVVAVRRLDRPGGAWGRRLRSRLLLGVPWGTLVSVGVVLAVYLFVQDGAANWNEPVALPFHSWSYRYPLGMATGPFAHSGPGHLVGNLLGALTLGPLAEYAWSHFPSERGSHAFADWRSNPYVRAFVLFPAGVLGVGLATALLGWGPLIGFSGVVFAFGGFALVRYPIGTVVALVAWDVLDAGYSALQRPVVPVEPRPVFFQPEAVAVQGHLLGLFLGALLGVLVVVRARDERPSALRLWTGVVLFATTESLWQLYWFRDGGTLVFYRGLGVLLVLVLGLWVAWPVRAAVSEKLVAFEVPRRQVATLALVLPLLTMAFVAVPVNLTTVADADVPGGAAVELGDYTVTYAEDVPNGMVSTVDLSAFGETTRVNASGVIVVSERRSLWYSPVSTGALAFDGARRVTVGGVGWRESAVARRLGWTATGGGTAYQVWLRPEDGDWRHAYASGPATAAPVLAGKNASVVPDEGRFFVAVADGNGTVARARMPADNGTATLAGIRFVREESVVFATYNGTRVPVFEAESYE